MSGQRVIPQGSKAAFPTDVVIRRFEDRDYAGAVAVNNVVFPDYPWSEEEWRHYYRRFDGQRLKHDGIVAERRSEMLGFAEWNHRSDAYHPRKVSIDVMVRPEVQGRGIGARLYDALLQTLVSVDPLVLWGRAREHDERSITFLDHRGFQEVQRMWEARLDVAGFDPSPFEEKAAQALRASDGQIVTVAQERERDPEWFNKLYDLHLETSADVPRVGDFTPKPLEQTRRNLLENPGFLPEAHYLLKIADRYVAESNLFRSDKRPDVLYQGITGTRRAYRGRGIALALKLRTIDYARRHGFREIRTWNDNLNAPMLHINLKMGFVRQPAWLTFEKRPKDA